MNCSAEMAKSHWRSEWTNQSRTSGHGPFPLEEPEGVGDLVYNLGDFEDWFQLSFDEYQLCSQYYYLRGLHIAVLILLRRVVYGRYGVKELL